MSKRVTYLALELDRCWTELTTSQTAGSSITFPRHPSLRQHVASTGGQSYIGWPSGAYDPKSDLTLRGVTLGGYHFLAALPAVLAFAGFVVLQVLGSLAKENPTTRRIVAKLRREAPGTVNSDQRLSAKQVEGLIQRDQNLKRIVGEQDYALLQRILRQDFLKSLFIYSSLFVLCGLSVVLFYQQSLSARRLNISGISLVDNEPAAAGILVDLDPITVTWKTSGDPEDVNVYLENVQSSVRSDVLKVPSDAHMVNFTPQQCQPILESRELKGINRVRAVFQTSRTVFNSDERSLHVGVTVLTVLDSSSDLTVAAMIDNQRVPFYDFQARIVVLSRFPTGKPLVVGNNIAYSFAVIKVSNPRQFDWNSAKGVYFGPDDARLFRFQFLIDDSFRGS